MKTRLRAQETPCTLPSIDAPVVCAERKVDGPAPAGRASSEEADVQVINDNREAADATLQQTADGAENLAEALAEPHPSWPARYRVEAEVLRVALGALAPVIEHVGSTAVAGLAARPVIDIAIGVAQPAALDAQTDRLANFGYQLIHDADLAPDAADRFASERVLVRRLRGVCTHRVEVVRIGGEAWHQLLMFRDMLRLDRELARSYESIKRELLRQARGRAALYASGKADFIRAALGRPAFGSPAAQVHGRAA